MLSHDDGRAVADAVERRAMAHLRVYKRPLQGPEHSNFGIELNPGRSVHVSGRGAWGVFLNAKNEAAEDWQRGAVWTSFSGRQ